MKRNRIVQTAKNLKPHPFFDKLGLSAPQALAVELRSFGLPIDIIGHVLNVKYSDARMYVHNGSAKLPYEAAELNDEHKLQYKPIDAFLAETIGFLPKHVTNDFFYAATGIKDMFHKSTLEVIGLITTGMPYSQIDRVRRSKPGVSKVQFPVNIKPPLSGFMYAYWRPIRKRIAEINKDVEVSIDFEKRFDRQMMAHLVRQMWLTYRSPGLYR